MVVSGYCKHTLAERSRPGVRGHRLACHLCPVRLHTCELDRPLQAHDASCLGEGSYDWPRARAVTTRGSTLSAPVPCNPALAAISAHRRPT